MTTMGTGTTGTGTAGIRYDDDVITGEAVLVDVWPASFVTRALALSLDLVAQIVIAGIIAVVLARTVQGDEATAEAIGLVAYLSVLLFIPVAIETLSRGRSLGKLAAGLRVVRDDGGPIRARHAIIRGLFGVFEIYGSLGSIAMICSLANKRGKRFGDLLAGTYVIRERAARPFAGMIPMPPPLTYWAPGIDLGRIPDQLALAARQFLIRQPTLAPEVRARLAAELAAAVLPLVAPPPPYGTPADQFLMAVLAERTRREYGRLTQDAALRHRRDHHRRTAPVSTIGTGLVERS